MHAKVINGEIVFAVIEFEGWTNVETGVLIAKPTEEDFAEAGYQTVVQTPCEMIEGKMPIPYYEVEDGEIVQHWRYEDDPKHIDNSIE